jgi:hypothetical protein
MKVQPFVLISATLALLACNAAQGGGSTVIGTVERVWEDGFRLNTGSRTVNVDTWDVFGDNTAGRVRIGERVSVAGEMSGGEFDASAVTGAGGSAATAGGGAASAGSRDAGTTSGRPTLTGTVERVWEDGFRLNTGARSVKVDTWDVFGDNTRSRVSVGQRVSVSGEMSGREFDALGVDPL